MQDFKKQLLPGQSLEFRVEVKFLCNRKYSLFGLQTNSFHTYIKGSFPHSIELVFRVPMEDRSELIITNSVPVLLCVDVFSTSLKPNLPEYLSRMMNAKEAIHFIRVKGVSQVSGRVDI